MLELRRPGDAYSVVHFWRGENGAFTCWYVNLEEPFRRTPIGFDSSDQELDIVVLPDRSWFFKDWDLLDQHVARGRYSPELVATIRAEGLRIGAELDARTHWWDDQHIRHSNPRGQRVKTGSFSQPRTVGVWACLTLSQSTSQSGQRFSTSSSATRPSSRASAAPRQKWRP